MIFVDCDPFQPGQVGNTTVSDFAGIATAFNDFNRIMIAHNLRYALQEIEKIYPNVPYVSVNSTKFYEPVPSFHLGNAHIDVVGAGGYHVFYLSTLSHELSHFIESPDEFIKDAEHGLEKVTPQGSNKPGLWEHDRAATNNNLRRELNAMAIELQFVNHFNLIRSSYSQNTIDKLRQSGDNDKLPVLKLAQRYHEDNCPYHKFNVPEFVIAVDLSNRVVELCNCGLPERINEMTEKALAYWTPEVVTATLKHKNDLLEKMR